MQQPTYSVVQVVDQLNVGGAEQMVVMLANLLQAHGHKAAIVTTVATGPLAARLHPDVQHINLKRRWKWNPVTMFRLVKVLKGFNIVHVHAAYNLRYVYFASRIFFLRKPIFYHEHYGNAVNTIPHFVQRHIYAQTFFIAVSAKLADWAKSRIGLSQEKVFLLPNTIIKSDTPDAYSSSNKLRLCTVGNVLPNKNIQFALQLLCALQENKKQSVHLTIIGTIADEQYHQQLLQFIYDEGLQQSISFITDCSDVQTILYQFDAAIHCSLSESGPLVLIEYLAQGLPFVTYNTGEVAAQLQPHIPAFIMHDFHIVKWLQAVENIITLPRQEIAAQFNQLYQTYFSPEAYYNKCITIYKAGLQRTPLQRK